MDTTDRRCVTTVWVPDAERPTTRLCVLPLADHPADIHEIVYLLRRVRVPA